MEMSIKMSEISNNQNLEAHYVKNPKVQRTVNSVVTAPQTVPHTRLFSDKDANSRMKMINHDIYQDSQKEKKRELLAFLKFLGGFAVFILGIKCIKHLFKKS